MNKHIKLLNKFGFFPMILLVFISVCSFAQINIDYIPELREKITLDVENLIQKDPKLKALSIPLEGQVYIPPGANPEVQRKLKRVAAYDVGSTGVKFKLADVDPFTQKIVNEIYSKTIDTKFKIEEKDFLNRIAIIPILIVN
jgi:hypothetical protein